jgi:3,4-dihydroxy 2-butanone 4-phosphate synthase/GTP cyclohydrolase II
MATDFATIEEALEALRQGEMIVLVDDENRENEGDLVCAAEKVTPDIVNFMASRGRGLICLAITGEQADRLGLPPQTASNTSQFSTAFTVSVDARSGVSTGISAHDRAHTIQIMMEEGCRPDDLARPGHIFPLRARDGGTLVRAGQTEGAVDLARMAGLKPAGVICEIMNDDGTMARVPDLKVFCAKYNLKLVTVASIIDYRRRKEKLIRRAATTPLPTRFGKWQMIAYESLVDPLPHVALVMGDVETVGKPDAEPVLVRMHSECLTGDVFGSQKCDCGQQIDMAMQMIAEQGRGAVIYMRQEGRGIGIVNKVHAYRLQEEKGLDTVEANEALGFAADLRDYGVGAQVLLDLGIDRIRLLTNNEQKVVGLAGYGLELVERVPLVVKPTEHSLEYLRTKQKKMGHHLEIP